MLDDTRIPSDALHAAYWVEGYHARCLDDGNSESMNELQYFELVECADNIIRGESFNVTSFDAVVAGAKKLGFNK